MRIASIHIYPVKGLRGRAANAAHVDSRGLRGDRRAMIVDRNGRFLSQREAPELARIAVEETADGLVLHGPEGRLRAARPVGRVRRTVTVWRDAVEAAVCDRRVDEALSDWLGQPASLVFMDEASHRSADPAWAGDGVQTSFADGFPILVTTTASLRAVNEALNARCVPPVGMERFRPNVVVETDVPFDEDGWARIAAGDVELDLVKPCSRCIVTTIDQETGETRVDEEPLATLLRVRRSADRAVAGALFGWNAVPRVPGTIGTGQAVAIMERRPRPWPIAPDRERL